MPDLVLELLSEEIPARMQAAAATQLRERFEAMLADAGLQADRIETFVTPRRLALLAHGLPAASQATSEERRGPRSDAPDAAVAGFLKSTGLIREQLEDRETGKGRFLFAVIDRPGEAVADVLAAKLPAMVEGFQWPKSMRWLETPFRWVRPLRGIVALLDRDVVAFNVQGISSGDETQGHRLMGQGAIALDSAAGYVEAMRAAMVVVDPAERAAMIREGAAKATASAGLELVADEALEAENAGLTEWPVPLLGRFAPEFLEVPPEIIQLTMKVNQKYFPVVDGDGVLAPAFVCVANLDAPDGGKTIVAGNERVLSARLADARFFWEQDGKKTLDQHAEGLKGIVFHEKLGTMAEKVERVAKLARWLVETYPDQFPGATPELVERAARLARADLVTGTVGEFPELQGVIGGHLAAAQGEPDEVVAAIRQFYAPVPEGSVAVAVALADRLDTLIHSFAAGDRPTGSKDPFALRRAAISIIAMISNDGLRFALRDLLHSAAPGPSGAGFAHFEQMAMADDEERIQIIQRLVDDVFAFLVDRLKVQQREAGVRPDVIDAVIAPGGEDDLVRLLDRVKALQAFIETDDGVNLLAGYRRAANILRAEEKKDGREYRLDAGTVESDYIGETEKNLARLFAKSDGPSGVLFFDEADALFGKRDFAGLMQRLATLRAPVDAFFEDVVVNDPDPVLRERRLRLLAGVRAAMHRVADFSKIQTSDETKG